MLPANVFAVGTEDTLSDSSPLYADVESSPSVVREVEDLRTEDGKQFQMSDGSFMAVSYGMPVHFQSEDGSWMDIDNALQLTDGDAADTMYEAANGSARISFAPDLTKDTVFTTTYADQSISFSLLNQDNYSSVAEDESQPGLESSSSAEDTGNSQNTPSEGTTENATEAEPASQETEPETSESSAPENEPETAEEAAILPVEPSTYHSAVEAQLVQGEQTSTYTGETGDMQKLDDTLIPEKLTSSVLYENVFQGVDLQYNATGYNIKESIIVKEPLDSYRFSFKMNLSGLTPQLDEDGSVVLLDAYALGSDLCGFHCHRNRGTVYLYNASKVLSQCVGSAFCEVGAVIHDIQKNTVNSQARIDVLPDLSNGLHQLCHSLCRKVLRLHGNDYAICRRQSIQSYHTE